MSTFREEIIGSCRLILGDCREVLPTLGPVDAVVTDPPYGIGADKKGAHSSIRDNAIWADRGWDDGRPSRDTLGAILASAPAAAIWGGNYFADCLPASSGWLAWVKPEADTGFSLADMELCWTSVQFAARTKRLPRRDGNEHPTQKPVSVMAWTLGFMPGRSVLDPYMGSGTTGVACVQLDRPFIGIEREPAYFDIARRRIAEAYRQPRLFAEPIPKPVQLSMLDSAAPRAAVAAGMRPQGGV